MAFNDNDYYEAADRLRFARTFMPQEVFFEDLEAFYRGHACLEDGDPGEAVRWFQVSMKLDPSSEETAHMLFVAQRQEAFKSGKYEDYFHASESLLELEGRTSQTLLAMAPAWACRYVLTGNEEYRKQALACLLEAQTAEGWDPDDWIIEGWVNRIIEKRTIISLIDYRISIGKGSTNAENFG